MASISIPDGMVHNKMSSSNTLSADICGKFFYRLLYASPVKLRTSCLDGENWLFLVL
jgi:hypothetical protein